MCTRKKILYLTFYFGPDLCAGSFRNTPLVEELAKQAKDNATIDVITTVPNRYRSFEIDAPSFEKRDNYTVTRITIPKHESGIKDQIFSFQKYYRQVLQIVGKRKYDLVVASSSRLFTAYLGYSVAKRMNAKLYLDIRDIFYDTLDDLLKGVVVRRLVLPLIKSLERRTFGYASHINLISEGFKPYFSSYTKARFSYYPNAIDDIFIRANDEEDYFQQSTIPSAPKTIVYAGNIGEGQGLHKIVPQVASALGGEFKFVIIGDGGAKKKLVDKIDEMKLDNVELRSPVQRDQLIDVYKNADFLFVHLNNFKAFEKVLPSKLFELATFPKPIIAGVGGFAAEFVRKNIDNCLLFEPCNVKDLLYKLDHYSYKQIRRSDFINKFERGTINKAMSSTILTTI